MPVARKTASFGRLVEDEPCLKSPPDTSIRAFKWVPDRRQNREVPAGWALRLLIVEGSDGVRQVFPRGSIQEFLEGASACGRGILFRKMRPNGAVRQSYRLMHHLFQGSFNQRRMMVRRFNRLEDLSLTRTERSGDSTRNILPEIMLPGQQRPLTRNELHRLGVQARQGSRAMAGTASVLEAGLLKAAEAYIPTGPATDPSKPNGVVQLALFGLEAGELPDERTVEEIEGRLCDAVWRKRGCPPGRFDRFLHKDTDNLVQQLAKRKPPVTRTEVHQVLNQLLWRSFIYVSQCIATQMQEVCDSMDPPLSTEERRLFAHKYRMVNQLGGVVPIALSCRLGFMCLFWDQLAATEPASEGRAWTALVQALLWHNEMVANRRKADALQKEQKKKCAVIARRSRSMVLKKRRRQKKPLHL